MNAAFILTAAFVFVFCLGTGNAAYAQKGKSGSSAKTKAAAQTVDPNLPKVTRINEAEFSNIIKKSSAASRPVLVNFWATWCDPCREEFPDLVKIDEDFGGRGLDLVAVSMDEANLLKTLVPQFLSQVKMKTPSFLLVAQDEAAFLESVTADGNKNEAAVGLPVTVLFDAAGKIVYKRSGKFKPEVLRAEIEKLIPPAPAQ